ncbi:MAG: DUF4292 domain-containing protein [Muribaculaceae bacterium]|nr:DUF4292 domain-containing protein [Muribaculaceae bacterium]
MRTFFIFLFFFLTLPILAQVDTLDTVTDSIIANEPQEENLNEFMGEPVEEVDSVAIGIQAEELADSIISLPDYEPWEIASIQGKLKMEGLPLSPSLKIFMQRDSIINISAHAPFVGEVLRIEIDSDSICCINKMKKTFFKEGYKEGLNGVGYGNLGIPEIQDLLLARFFLPGIDIYETELDNVIDIYEEDNQLNVIPKGEALLPDVTYGFVVDGFFNPLMIILLPSSRPDIELDITYTYKLQGYDIDFSYTAGQRNINMALQLNEPKWSGNQPKGIDLRKYRQQTLSEFLRSF